MHSVLGSSDLSRDCLTSIYKLCMLWESHSAATVLQELRKSIVPSAAAYKLDKLMAAIETYQQRTRQRVRSRSDPDQPLSDPRSSAGRNAGWLWPIGSETSGLMPQVFMEYVMLRDVNDGPEQAHELGKLLQGRNVVQNLIPWNPVYR